MREVDENRIGSGGVKILTKIYIPLLQRLKLGNKLVIKIDVS
jgi:hypothetical protein